MAMPYIEIKISYICKKQTSVFIKYADFRNILY